ncbi:MAG: TIM barrel protein [Chloroflexota bacterium]
MKLRLGINTCFAVKRWPQAEAWAPIVADRLGLRLVQHSFDLVTRDVDDPAALRRVCDGHGLELASTFTGLAAYSANLLLDPRSEARQAAEAWFTWAIGWTAAAGATATGGHVGAFSVAGWRDPVTRAARWSGLQDALARLATTARTAGLEQLVIENLAVAREPSTMAMVHDLVTDGDAARVPVGLCLDTGHMCVVGTEGDERDPYAWLRAMAPVTAMLQLQQSDAEGDHHWPFTAARNAQGRVDADRVIDALGEGGVEQMDAYLEVIPSFEQDDDEVLDDLEASVDHWREALARRGVHAA